MRRLWPVLLALSLGWIAALIQAGQPIGWDEIEYFRASRWVGEGRVPYRDFWEHHTPLQWLLFGPVARLFGNGPGTASIVAMRWAQVLLWMSGFAALLALMRRAGLNRDAVLCGTVFLLVSSTFSRAALEFRLDVPGNAAFLAALLIAAAPMTRLRAVAAGVLMSAAVLANMRIAPLVIISTVAVSFWSPAERKWRWNGALPWMALAASAVAAAFVSFLAVTEALEPFVEGVIRYNIDSSGLLDVDTFAVTLLAPLSEGDVAGVVFWIVSLGGLVIALRGIREPGPAQMAGVLGLASLATFAAMEVHYPYHLQTTWLLMLPLAALGFSRLLPRWSAVVGLAAGAGLLVAVVPLAAGSPGAGMRYQDAVMRAVDRHTRPDEEVWDGCGYALRRKPAYRYWFLPAGIRLLAGSGHVEAYDPAADPPAAIIYNLRLQRWFEMFPRAAFFATHHYVPLYRNLWIPGLSAVVPPQRRLVWTMVRGGTYDVRASQMLLRHPWLTRPLEYAATPGPQAAAFEIPLDRLPLMDAGLMRWRIDGKEQAAGTTRLVIRRGARVELVSSAPGEVGLLVVPVGMTRLAVGPAEPFEF